MDKNYFLEEYDYLNGKLPCANYCKNLNVSVPFISRILRAEQNREIKGREYQLQAKITTVFWIVWF